MWQTSRGIRMLRGAEALLFCAGVNVLVDNLAMEFDDAWQEDPTVQYPSGIALFDGQEPTQRIGSLHEITSYLLTDAGPPPEANAVTEAAIAAVFMEIRDQVSIEVDFRDPREYETPDSSGSHRQGQSGERSSPSVHAEPPQLWRKMVLDALVERRLAEGLEAEDPDQLMPTADLECRDMANWDAIIEGLADEILWDRDFELADLFMDADPGRLTSRRKWLGIEPDYFSSVSADPRPNEVARLVAETRRLVRRQPR